ncbi:BTB/POZ domain-containing protein At3g08570-like [Zingiber officinale]|uniref:BTB/POZ domain-containing protein At3g08570-like n=1 Tax=Zingiber officinale TaxID=94328 RepID=UPI001C4BF8FC|nr:BTB/POZ domain-containing protein At3g08570-like [Zingiber officinale]
MGTENGRKKINARSLSSLLSTPPSTMLATPREGGGGESPYRASLDPSCWRRLNFRSLDFTPWSPFSCAFALRYRLHSPLSFSAFLRFALHRSRGVVDQLAFPLSSAVSIHDLAYASIKCPRLKALAFPDNLMLEDDLRIPELVRRWKDLEHLVFFLKLVSSSRFKSLWFLMKCRFVLCRIFSDVAGDVTIYVDGQSFLLHKFPLVSRSGKIWKMVVESREPDLSRLELHEVLGGAEAFELAAKFCYGTNFEITASNVAQLRCIAEYLEMTEQYQERNLIVRAEAFLNEVVFQSLEKSLEVLSSSNGLSPIVDEVGIVNRCIDAIVINASKEQLVSSLAHLECDSRSGKLMMHCQDWWVEDLSVLKIDLYRRVIAAMRRAGDYVYS